VEGETDPEALGRYARAHLAPWQVPRDFWVVAELPADDRGKSSRRALRERYLAGRTPSRDPLTGPTS
jgi:acyl-CoA synthetase (AMP-forming)/AMP-acid ligase II